MTKKISFNRWRQVMLLIILILVVGGLIWLNRYFLVVKNVVFYDHRQQPLSLTTNWDELKDKSIFFTNFEALEIFKNVFFDPQNQEYYFITKLEKELPQTLIVTVDKETPVYNLTTASQTNLVVTNHGRVKTTAALANLPTVQLASQSADLVIKQNAVEPQFHQFIVKLFEALVDLPYQQVVAESLDKIVIELAGDKGQDKQAVLEITQNPEIEIKKINLTLEQVEFDKLDFVVRTIDMRFKNPVLQPADQEGQTGQVNQATGAAQKAQKPQEDQGDQGAQASQSSQVERD